jgi:hypothetical protein
VKEKGRKALYVLMSVLITATTNAQNYVPACAADHYVALKINESPSKINSTLLKNGEPRVGINGLQTVLKWKDIEPEEGVYNWKAMEDFLGPVYYLNSTRGTNYRVYFMFHWKGFGTGAIQNPLPDWVLAKGNWHSYQITDANLNSTALLYWREDVKVALKRLFDAIGQRFDAAGMNSAFGGIILQETANGLGKYDAENPNNLLVTLGYTTQKHVDSYGELLLHVGEAVGPVGEAIGFATWWANDYTKPGIDPCGNLCYRKKLGDIILESGLENVWMGGPDILPNSPQLERLVYPMVDDPKYTYDIKWFNASQYDGYRQSDGNGGYLPPKTITEFGTERVASRRIVWTGVNLGSPWYQGIDEVYAMLENDELNCAARGCHP